MYCAITRGAILIFGGQWFVNNCRAFCRIPSLFSPNCFLIIFFMFVLLFLLSHELDEFVICFKKLVIILSQDVSKTCFLLICGLHLDFFFLALLFLWLFDDRFIGLLCLHVFDEAWSECHIMFIQICRLHLFSPFFGFVPLKQISKSFESILARLSTLLRALGYLRICNQVAALLLMGSSLLRSQVHVWFAGQNRWVFFRWMRHQWLVHVNFRLFHLFFRLAWFHLKIIIIYLFGR